MNGIDLRNGDCLDVLKEMQSETVDLVLTDPPYNIGVHTQKNNRNILNEWDKIPNYTEWCIDWLKECQRVLKPNGVLYFWHNDILQLAELLEAIKKETDFEFVSFCIWDKGCGYRAKSWKNRKADSPAALRSWFNICEYCLHFFKAPKVNGRAWAATGLERINSNPECYRPLKDWYAAEVQRLRLTKKDISNKYTEVTGKKPYMLGHYFKDSQFEIPTKKIWESVYRPLGFSKEYEELRKEYEELRKEYEELRKEYEELRKEYEELRNYHCSDSEHCNIWHVPPIQTHNRLHTCQKPVDILERLIRVSCREGGTVFDPFMGSGSTAIAAINTGRSFIGIEKEEKYYDIAKRRIRDHLEVELNQISL